MLDETSPHGIQTNIFPFFGERFIRSQQAIENNLPAIANPSRLPLAQMACDSKCDTLR